MPSLPNVDPSVSPAGEFALTLVGGPTVIIEIGGLRLLTDPTFDPPGDHPIGSRTLVKLSPPAVPAERIGQLDGILLSHDQHPDNLDTAGRRVLADVPRVITTASATARLGGNTETLPVWQHADIARPDGDDLVITGVPALHDPDGSESVTGEVMGFVLTGTGVPTVYVSGDNASLDIVQSIADRCGPFDVAVLFAGAARTPLLDANLTLDSEQADRAADILGARSVAVVHTEGWAHFTQGWAQVVEQFERAGRSDRLLTLEPGIRHVVTG